MLLLAGLRALLAILAVLSRRLGRFDQIAGGRLGRVRRVLFRLRQFRSNAPIRSSSGAVALATAASIIASTSLRVKTLAMPARYRCISSRKAGFWNIARRSFVEKTTCINALASDFCTLLIPANPG